MLSFFPCSTWSCLSHISSQIKFNKHQRKKKQGLGLKIIEQNRMNVDWFQNNWTKLTKTHVSWPLRDCRRPLHQCQVRFRANKDDICENCLDAVSTMPKWFVALGICSKSMESHPKLCELVTFRKLVSGWHLLLEQELSWLTEAGNNVATAIFPQGYNAVSI